MKKSKGVSLIALVITIIVIVILAAIVMNSSSDIISNALYAKFVQEFGDYRQQVNVEAAKIRTPKKNKEINDAQTNYMVANGLRNHEDLFVFGYTTPVGYILPDTIMRLYRYQKLTAPDATTPPDNSTNSDNLKSEIADSYLALRGNLPMVAYVIDDSNISGYNIKSNNYDGSAGYEFYGDTNGSEYHFITSTGHVFSLPGFAIPVEDGTTEYHISNENGAYYVIRGSSGLEIGAANINGDEISETRPIVASDLDNLGLWGMKSSGDIVDKYLYDTEKSSFGLQGRYTSIGYPTRWES